jgi:hypothetical protein
MQINRIIELLIVLCGCIYITIISFYCSLTTDDSDKISDMQSLLLRIAGFIGMGLIFYMFSRIAKYRRDKRK